MYWLENSRGLNIVWATSEQLLEWRKNILKIKEILANEVKIYFLSWIWYFWYAIESNISWLRVLWKEIFSFPSRNFNINNNIWDKNGVIESLDELKKMFECIWFRIASDEDEELLFEVVWIKSKKEVRWVSTSLSKKVTRLVEKDSVSLMTKADSDIFNKLVWRLDNWKKYDWWKKMNKSWRLRRREIMDDVSKKLKKIDL